MIIFKLYIIIYIFFLFNFQVGAQNLLAETFSGDGPDTTTDDDDEPNELEQHVYNNNQMDSTLENKMKSTTTTKKYPFSNIRTHNTHDDENEIDLEQDNESLSEESSTTTAMNNINYQVHGKPNTFSFRFKEIEVELNKPHSSSSSSSKNTNSENILHLIYKILKHGKELTTNKYDFLKIQSRKNKFKKLISNKLHKNCPNKQSDKNDATTTLPSIISSVSSVNNTLLLEKNENETLPILI